MPSAPPRPPRRVPGWAAAVFGAGITAAWLTKARCLLFEPGWDNGEQYLGYCYTDIYPLWWAERLNEGAVPYFGHPVEYPVLTGAWMWVANTAAGIIGGQARTFLQITMLMGAAMLAGAFVLLRRMGVPPRRLLWFAASPTLIAYAFVNWDALPVLLAVAAIWQHRKGADVAAGVLAGLGGAAKLYPLLLLPLFVLARLRQRRSADAVATAGAAVAAWAAVNLPVYLGAPDGWGRFLELSRERPADHDSLYRIAEVYLRGDVGFPVAPLNVFTGVAFLVLGGLVVWVGSRRRAPAETWQLSLPLLIVFLLTSKVYSPQFSLWLLPLFPLVLPRFWPFLAFSAADLAVFLTRFSWLGGRQGFSPAVGFPWFAAAIGVRAIVLVAIVWLTVRQPPTPPPEPSEDLPGVDPGAREHEPAAA